VLVMVTGVLMGIAAIATLGGLAHRP